MFLTVTNIGNSINGYVYDFYVDYNTADASDIDIVDILNA